MEHSRKALYLFFVIVSAVAALEADGSFFRLYGVRSAIIQYEIGGESKIAKGSVLKVEGKASLVFSDWGARQLEKEKTAKISSGAIRNIQTFHLFRLRDGSTVYRADFDNHRMQKREDLLFREAITTGRNLYREKMRKLEKEGENRGKSIVADLSCDEWLFEGKKICYYKGIPLKEEYEFQGIPVIKRAVNVELDKNISGDEFSLPDFVLNEKGGYLLRRKKIPASQSPEVGKQMIENSTVSSLNAPLPSELLDEGSGPETEAVDRRMSEALFEKQKSLLQELFEEMKEARVCLESAEVKEEADACMKKLWDTKEKLSGKRMHGEEISSWTKREKETMLSELEMGIMELKRKMPCIHRSQNINDLSICMMNEMERKNQD